MILDARHERVCDAGVIAHQAVLVAIGINWKGQRQVLAVELANRESESSRNDLLLRLQGRGLATLLCPFPEERPGLSTEEGR